jgi:hypothetical protein
MTQVLSVRVERDHLESLIAARRPLEAIIELIWNGLDADATNVTVRLNTNDLNRVSRIEVADDGHGLEHSAALQSFSTLGGSTKRATLRTPQGRRFHGKLGRGRFRAFYLGDYVEWVTTYSDPAGRRQRYSITGRRDAVDTFTVEDPQATSEPLGTHVRIEAVVKDYHSLKRASEVVAELAEEFALYLRQYPDVSIRYEGYLVDPAAAEERVTDKDLGELRLSTGQIARASLTIIEWKSAPSKRTLFLCDSAGFSLYDVQPGIQAPGFHFTAYVKSDALRDLQNELPAEELHPDVKLLLDSARDEMRMHFRQREAEVRSSKVDQWKREQVYPFVGEPKNLLEESERQVFDIVALTVSEEVAEFEAGPTKVRRLAFHLLREAITSDPTALTKILHEVVELPKERQEEFARLLERTSLDAIIAASKLVSDRLEFLAGLESLLFDEPHRGALKERTQLQRIVADHTWIFGEEYHLTVDDESLNKVLETHLGGGTSTPKKSKRGKKTAAKVVREDGRTGVVDLMLSRRVPQPDPSHLVHLVVELKPPSVSITTTVLEQIHSYAQAIAEDERFKGANARWEFWALSNVVAPQVARMGRQAGHPLNCVYLYAEPAMRIWVKPWSEVINDARARLRFFQDQLQYRPDAEGGLDFLRRTHAKYLPKSAATPPGDQGQTDLELSPPPVEEQPHDTGR